MLRSLKSKVLFSIFLVIFLISSGFVLITFLELRKVINNGAEQFIRSKMAMSLTFLDELYREKTIYNQRELHLQPLEEALRQVRILGTGEIFLLDSSGHSITADRPFPTGTGIDLSTGKPFLPELLQAAKTPPNYLKYQLEEDGKPVWRESYIYPFPPLGWYIASSITMESVLAPSQFVLKRQMMALSITTLLCFLLGYLLTRAISRPLEELAEQVESFELMPSKAGVQLKPVTALKTQDWEIVKLAQTFDRLRAKLASQVQEVIALTKEQERIGSELEVAKDTQAKILPTKQIPLAMRRSLDVAATILPARDVAGDFYDFFLADTHLLYFCIGDVADKGMAAAWTMTMVMTLERVFSHSLPGEKKHTPTPNEVLHHINEEFCEQTHSFDFITMFLGLMNVRTGELLYSHAGHLPPLLISASRAKEWRALPLKPSRPLGVKRDSLFELAQIKLLPGDRLCLYTDGALESKDDIGKQMAQDGLGALMASTSHMPAAEAMEAMEQQFVLREKGGEPGDDISLLYLHYKGVQLPMKRELVVGQELSEIARCQEMARELAPPLSHSELLELELILEEMVKNIADYSLQPQQQFRVTIELLPTSTSKILLQLRFCYPGPPFDPRSYLANPTKGSRDIGGRGLLIVSRLVDKIEYLRHNELNEVTLHKEL